MAEQVVVRSGQPRRAGRAAQAEKRQTFDVRSQTEGPDQPRLQRRHRHSGDRGGDDEVDLVGPDVRLLQCASYRCTGEIGGRAQVAVVGGREAGQTRIFLDREREVTGFHSAVGVDAAQHLAQFWVMVTEDQVGKGLGDLGLLVAMVGQHAGHRREQAHGRHGRPNAHHTDVRTIGI